MAGARVQGGDLLGLGRTSRQDEDRDRRPAAKTSDDVDTVHIRQAEIHDDRIGMAPGCDGERRATRWRQMDLAPPGVHVHFHRAEDRHVVVHDENDAHGAPRPCATPHVTSLSALIPGATCREGQQSPPDE